MGGLAGQDGWVVWEAGVDGVIEVDGVIGVDRVDGVVEVDGVVGVDGVVAVAGVWWSELSKLVNVNDVNYDDYDDEVKPDQPRLVKNWSLK